MARRLPLVLGMAAIGFAATPASATVYVNKRVCGGDIFATCAALWLDVSYNGNNTSTVTFRIFNLSANTVGSYGVQTVGGTMFNGIGFYNVPAGVNAITGTNALSVLGPVASTSNKPGKWTLRNNATVGFMMDFTAVPNGFTQKNPYDNAIASGCASSNLLPNINSTTASLFMNPCAANPSAQAFSNWVTFTFNVTGNWNASGVGIMFRGYDLANHYTKSGILTHSTECWDSYASAAVTGRNAIAATCVTVTPEPMTMTLLATGLVGLGGAGYIRRRRSNKK